MKENQQKKPFHGIYTYGVFSLSIVLAAECITLFIAIFNFSHHTGSSGAVTATLEIWRHLFFIEGGAIIMVLPGVLVLENLPNSRQLRYGRTIALMVFLCLVSIPLFLFSETFSGSVSTSRLLMLKIYWLGWGLFYLLPSLICIRFASDFRDALRWIYRTLAVLLVVQFLLWKWSGKTWLWPWAGSDELLLGSSSSAILVIIPMFLLLFLVRIISGRGQR